LLLQDYLSKVIARPERGEVGLVLQVDRVAMAGLDRAVKVGHRFSAVGASSRWIIRRGDTALRERAGQVEQQLDIRVGILFQQFVG
jgi:hypothetical protein